MRSGTLSKRRQKASKVWLVGLAFGLSAVSCSQPGPVERFEFTSPHMGTLWKVVVYSDDRQLASTGAEMVFERVAYLDARLSDYDAGSEVRQLSGQWTPVADDLWRVLSRSQKIAAESGGAFDVSVGALTRLWRRALRHAEIPGSDKLAAAREVSGHGKLELDEVSRRVRLVPGMRVDLGAIGKGYALDEAMKILRSLGLPVALVDAGGDVIAGDPPPGRADWKVRVVGNGGPFVVGVSNAAVATSGDLYQSVEIGGQRYSHIIDPRTGVALTGGAAATVVTQEATSADAWASTLCILGREEGGRFLSDEKKTAARVTRRLSKDGGAVFWETGGFSSLVD